MKKNILKIIKKINKSKNRKFKSNKLKSNKLKSNKYKSNKFKSNKLKKNHKRILKGGTNTQQTEQKIPEKEEAMTNIYSKSELKKKKKINKKMKKIKELIPLMNKMKEQLLLQVDTFDRLNKLLGDYFTNK